MNTEVKHRQNPPVRVMIARKQLLKPVEKKEQSGLKEVADMVMNHLEQPSQALESKEDERKRGIPGSRDYSDEFAYLDSEIFGDLVGGDKNPIVEAVASSAKAQVMPDKPKYKRKKQGLEADDDFYNIEEPELPFAQLKREFRNDFRYIAGMGQSQNDHIVFEYASDNETAEDRARRVLCGGAGPEPAPGAH